MCFTAVYAIEVWLFVISANTDSFMAVFEKLPVNLQFDKKLNTPMRITRFIWSDFLCIHSLGQLPRIFSGPFQDHIKMINFPGSIKIFKKNWKKWESDKSYSFLSHKVEISYGFWKVATTIKTVYKNFSMRTRAKSAHLTSYLTWLMMAWLWG